MVTMKCQRRRLVQEPLVNLRIKVLQKEVDAVMQKNPAVDETFTLAGFSQGLPSNQMLALAFLKDVSKRPPITQVIAEITQQLAQSIERFRPIIMTTLDRKSTRLNSSHI